MSDDKKGLPKPDGPGRWWYVTRSGHEGGDYVKEGSITAVADGDQWYRCYVPGLDKTGWPECDYPADALAAAWDSLKRAGVFTTKATFVDIDALAAQRDEARQEVEALHREREAANNRIIDLESELATLRQQQGKGEGDGELIHALDESTKDLVVTVGNITAEIRCSKDPNTAWRWEGVVEHLLNQIDANRKVLESSRAT